MADSISVMISGGAATTGGSVTGAEDSVTSVSTVGTEVSEAASPSESLDPPEQAPNTSSTTATVERADANRRRSEGRLMFPSPGTTRTCRERK
jgi:hypothetical protein